jgi:hypothetical protein
VIPGPYLAAEPMPGPAEPLPEAVLAPVPDPEPVPVPDRLPDPQLEAELEPEDHSLESLSESHTVNRGHL